MAKKTKKERTLKTIQAAVWQDTPGRVYEALCYACLRTLITVFNFDCGHIVAKSKGGKAVVTNLRPICRCCNSSMGVQNMHDFIRESRFWVGKPNPYWKAMLLRGEDPLLLYPEDARPSSLARRLDTLKKEMEHLIALRDLDAAVPESVIIPEDTTVPEETEKVEVVECPQPTPNQDTPKRKWKEAVQDAVVRRVVSNGNPLFSMKQLVEHELARIVIEVHCKGKTPKNTMARELQELREQGIVLFLDNCGHYRLCDEYIPEAVSKG